MSAHMFYTQVVPVSASPILISDGPFNYADNLWCRWVRSTHPHIHARIQARARARMHGKKVLDGSTAESIAISFTSLMTEAGYDFVRIYRGTQARACVRARAHVRAHVQMCVSACPTASMFLHIRKSVCRHVCGGSERPPMHAYMRLCACFVPVGVCMRWMRLHACLRPVTSLSCPPPVHPPVRAPNRSCACKVAGPKRQHHSQSNTRVSTALIGDDCNADQPLSDQCHRLDSPPRTQRPPRRQCRSKTHSDSRRACTYICAHTCTSVHTHMLTTNFTALGAC